MFKYFIMRSRWIILKLMYINQKYDLFLDGVHKFEHEYGLKPYQIAMKAAANLVIGNIKVALDQFELAYEETCRNLDQDQLYISGYCRASVLTLKGQVDAAKIIEEDLDKIDCNKELRRLLPNK